MEKTISQVGAVEGKVPSAIFPSKLTPTGYFDVEEVLYAFEFCGPEGFAKVLDEIMFDLGQYYLQNAAESAHSKSASNLFYLRLLRNAVLKGSGSLDFEDN